MVDLAPTSVEDSRKSARSQPRPTRIGLLVLALFTISGCQMAPSAPTDGSTPVRSASAREAELVYCVDEVNRYRASVGLPALGRSTALEAFAQIGVEHDASVRIPHDYFRQTNGGGVAKAETEILWWRGFATSRVISAGLAQMWAVGPGGEHYDILVGRYTDVGCGVFVSPSGEVSVSQDFR